MIMLENDDTSFTLEDTLYLCEKLDIPLVFDYHHHLAHHQDANWENNWNRVVQTWRHSPLPIKMHISSPKSDKEFRHHSDYVDIDMFFKFLKVIKGSIPQIDCMIEAKRKDEALFKLMDLPPHGPRSSRHLAGRRSRSGGAMRRARGLGSYRTRRRNVRSPRPGGRGGPSRRGSCGRLTSPASAEGRTNRRGRASGYPRRADAASRDASMGDTDRPCARRRTRCSVTSTSSPRSRRRSARSSRAIRGWSSSPRGSRRSPSACSSAASASASSPKSISDQVEAGSPDAPDGADRGDAAADAGDPRRLA